MASESTDVRTKEPRPHDEALAPTPQRKRIRHQEQTDCHSVDCDDSDIELVGEVRVGSEEQIDSSVERETQKKDSCGDYRMAGR